MASSDKTRGDRRKLKCRKYNLSIRKGYLEGELFGFVSFLLSGCHTLKQAAQEGIGVFILEDNQNPSGHCREQPALADPTFTNGVELNDLQRCLPAPGRTTQPPVIL